LLTYRNVKVHWLGHDSFVLEGSRTIVIDPFKAKGNYKADVLFISHEHYDHLSEDDIRRFSDQSTTIVAPRICEGQLRGSKSEKLFVEAGSTAETKGVAIEAIPAYNIDKFRSPGRVFHPKEDGRVGYIITLDGVRFYHAGDSDATPEMKAVDADVAFLPVSGTFVMTAEEAAGAAKAMNIKVAVPMHYGAGVVGTLRDAERFRDLLAGRKEVVILEKEG
jgi:L-ascorbate metabolism protein UlaG (beta-lactamase superfamily)